LVKAPVAGTGKSLLAKILLLIITGRRPALSTLPESEEELSKVLLSVIMEGGEYFVLDNVNRRINSGTLAAVITSGVLRGRILGKSEMITVPARTPVILTANNPDLSRDMARRCVTIDLSIDLENPAGRNNFKHPDLENYVLENRGRILTAAFTLARAWHNAGKPEGKATLGSFETWSRIIGGILTNAGISGFLSNAESFFRSRILTARISVGLWMRGIRNTGKARFPLLIYCHLPRQRGLWTNGSRRADRKGPWVNYWGERKIPFHPA
jgi:hypothetical protein